MLQSNTLGRSPAEGKEGSCTFILNQKRKLTFHHRDPVFPGGVSDDGCFKGIISVLGLLQPCG